MGPELMSYGSLTGESYLSDLTLAFLEDTGFYQPEYDARVMTKLLRNYRSHPTLLELPNRLFYANELVGPSSALDP